MNFTRSIKTLDISTSKEKDEAKSNLKSCIYLEGKNALEIRLENTILLNQYCHLNTLLYSQNSTKINLNLF